MSIGQHTCCVLSAALRSVVDWCVGVGNCDCDGDAFAIVCRKNKSVIVGMHCDYASDIYIYLCAMVCVIKTTVHACAIATYVHV